MIKYIISGLLIILSVPLFFAVVVLFTAMNTILDETFILESLEQADVYELPFVVEIGEFFDEDYISIGEEGAQLKSEIAVTLVTSLQDNASRIFGPEYVQAAIDPMVRGFYAWLKSDVSDLDLVIFLDEAKVVELATAFREDIVVTIQTLPRCTNEQVVDFDAGILYCIPVAYSEEDIDQLLESYASDIDIQIIEAIPRRIDVGRAIMQDASYQDLLVFRDNLTSVDSFVAMLVAVIAISFAVIARLHYQKNLLGWSGAFLLIVAILPMLVGGVVFWFGEYYEHILGFSGPDITLPAAIEVAIIALMRFVASGIGREMLLIAVPTGLVGVIAIVMNLVRKDDAQSGHVVSAHDVSLVEQSSGV